MATIITITKQDTKESITKKISELTKATDISKGFSAGSFTGKIKSFGDGIAYQSAIRNEWK